MKTKFSTIIAAIVLLISSTTYAFASTKADGGAVTLTEVGSISKIEASGNVEVYITNGKQDGVKVYNDYYGDNALVQNEDGVLRIASYKTDALIVIVTVTDLRAITANDNAIIKSYNNKLSALSLNIKLNDNAIASLDVDAVAANIAVNDQAQATLSGMIENYHLDYSSTAAVNKDELEAYTSTEREIKASKFTIIEKGAVVTASL
ncbi:GIN domain-containing protein [Mucilaginibacter calamicampi]|uniref:GIN domain-containing protein n=1 Tax=Mucilaginibacter calamicampi TaxID=1302352 RepID=A0ABW2YUL2_9SPHI